jgi:hypothetical protein
MAEHFYGKSFTVHFSNGAAKDLFLIFIEQSNKLPQTESLEKTVGFLQHQLNFVDGARAFSIDANCRIDDEILVDITNIIRLFVNELSKENPLIKSSEIFWDRDLRISWLARVFNLHFLITEYLKDRDISINTLQLDIPPEDKVTFERQKLLDIYNDRKLSKLEELKTYKEIVELSEADSKSVSKNYLSTVYLNYINLLSEKKDKPKLTEVWGKFLAIAEEESDVEGINLAKDFLNKR